MGHGEWLFRTTGVCCVLGEHLDCQFSQAETLSWPELLQWTRCRCIFPGCSQPQLTLRSSFACRSCTLKGKSPPRFPRRCVYWGRMPKESNPKAESMTSTHPSSKCVESPHQPTLHSHQHSLYATPTLNLQYVDKKRFIQYVELMDWIKKKKNKNLLSCPKNISHNALLFFTS